jgi:hypothetical protein
MTNLGTNTYETKYEIVTKISFHGFVDETLERMILGK